MSDQLPVPHDETADPVQSRALTVGQKALQAFWLGEARAGLVGMQRHWRQLANALRKLHAEGLYEGAYGPFVEEKLGISRRAAYRLMEDDATMNNLTDCASLAQSVPLPTNREQLRPLAGLQPTEQAAAWTEASERGRALPKGSERGSGRVTGKLVKQVVARRYGGGEAGGAVSGFTPGRDRGFAEDREDREDREARLEGSLTRAGAALGVFVPEADLGEGEASPCPYCAGTGRAR